MSTAAPGAAAGSTAGSLAARRRFRLLAVYRTTARVLLSYGALKLLTAVRGAAWAGAAAPHWHRTNARRVVRTVLAVQGLFIKIGQLVSTLAGVLPASFRDELALLQDRIPPRPWEEIRDRLTAELGASPEALFADVDRTAVAAASLAQVHAARLADGRRVAVKVQHLGIERLARLDLATARRVLAIAGFFTGARGLDGVFDSVQRMIDEELDFRREADHTERIAASLRRDPLLDAPPVVRELSTARVLVTGFVDGIKVSDLDALDARGIDRAALAQRILSRLLPDDLRRRRLPCRPASGQPPGARRRRRGVPRLRRRRPAVAGDAPGGAPPARRAAAPRPRRHAGRPARRWASSSAAPATRWPGG